MPKILVVDDSPEDRRLAVELIQQDPDMAIEEAENGRDAINGVRGWSPDVVLTDLHMPEMDGLELVSAIASENPDVPVILMTAHGSEAVAIDALRQGAASYVPKSLLAARLLNTIDQVLEAARADHVYKRLTEYMGDSTFAFQLENDRTLIRPLVDFVQNVLAGMRLCDASRRIQAGIALEEAMVNAMEHGNLAMSSELRERDEDAYRKLAIERMSQPPFCDRRIHINLEMNRSHANIVIRDEGTGFDPSNIRLPVEPPDLHKTTGRGLLLMQTFMDEVHFNDIGNEVTLVKLRG